MKANELSKRIESKTAPVIIDPRSQTEFNRGHIPGAINAPIGKILLSRAQLPEDQNIEMVIACMHGQRAWAAKKLLTRRGYCNIALLDGHLEGWKKAGLPWDK